MQGPGKVMLRKVFKMIYSLVFQIFLYEKSGVRTFRLAHRTLLFLFLLVDLFPDEPLDEQV